MSEDLATDRNKRFRILVVDDERFSRDIVRRQLIGLGAGYVVTVGSAGEARDAMKEDPNLGLVICDHYMAGESGIELLSELRCGRLPLAHDSFFVIASASRSFALSAVALALDVDSFLRKPFDREELARRLYQFLVEGDRVVKPAEDYRKIQVKPMLGAAERADPVAATVGKGKQPDALTPLYQVRMNSVLGADLRLRDGTVLLQRGTVLSPHLIRRLRELGVDEVSVRGD